MRIHNIIACLCLLLSATGMRAYEERNLLQNLATKAQVRDALVMNQEWVTYPPYQDRQAWDRFLGPLKDYYIKRGEAQLKYEWKVVRATDYLEFERSGSRVAMERPYNANVQAIADLLMAELAEGKGRFLDQLINGVFLSCEMTSWALSAHTVMQRSRRTLPSDQERVFDLVDGDMGNMLSWTYYFLKDAFDKVDPEISRRLRHELQQKVMDSYLQNNSYWWMGRGQKGSTQNNWNPWCNRNALITFMLLENDRDTLAQAVCESMRSVDQYLNFINGDGACDEGPAYWTHAAGMLIDYLELLSAVTQGKLNLLSHKLVRDMGEYISNSYVGNGWVVNFADASAKGGGDPFLVYRYGKDVGSQAMMQYAAVLRGQKAVPAPNRDVWRVLRAIDVSAELAAQSPSKVAQPFVWYPETEFCYMTSQEGLFLAAKGGHNAESHNHNDMGSFNLYIDEQPVIIDLGVGTYTRQTFSADRYKIWTMQSDYHNLPRINGMSELPGGQYRSRGTVARPGFFSADIAGGFPAEAKAQRWTRSYALKGDQLVVTDDFQLEEAVAPSVVNFMTWGDVREASPGHVSITVNGVRAQLDYDAKAFTLEIQPREVDDTRLSNVWGKRVYRLSFTPRQMQKKGRYRFTIKKV